LVQQRGVHRLEDGVYRPITEDLLKQGSFVLAGAVIKVGKRQYFRFQ
jgi:hypothetical protein